MLNTNYKSKYTGQQVDDAVDSVGKIISGETPVGKAKLLSISDTKIAEHSGTPENPGYPITEEGLYCVYAIMPEYDFCGMIYIIPDRRIEVNCNGRLLIYDGCSDDKCIAIYYDDYTPIDEGTLLIHKIL